jgi:hypothetical protein
MRQESLRVIDAGDGTLIRRHYHRARYYRPGNRSSADLVDSGEKRTDSSAQVALDHTPSLVVLSAALS